MRTGLIVFLKSLLTGCKNRGTRSVMGGSDHEFFATTISKDPPQPSSKGDCPWKCPWCDKEAILANSKSLCASRICGCGAVGFAAPPQDSDEIIDDAIGYFQVRTRSESCGFDALFLQDIQSSGIEIREGLLIEDPSTPFPDWKLRHLWFRREVEIR